MFIIFACKDTNKNKGIRNFKEYFSVEIVSYFFLTTYENKKIFCYFAI